MQYPQQSPQQQYTLSQYSKPQPQSPIQQYPIHQQPTKPHHTTILKPIVYEAMHVPINEQITSARSRSPYNTTAPPVPQFGTIKQNQPYQSTNVAPVSGDTKSNIIETTQFDHNSQERNNQQILNKHHSNQFEDRLKVIQQETELWKLKYTQLELQKQQAIFDLELKYNEELHQNSLSQKSTYSQSLHDTQEELKHVQQELDNANRETENARKRCHQLELDQFELKTQVVDAQSQRDTMSRDLQRVQMQYQKVKFELDETRSISEISRKRAISESDVSRLKDILLQRENEIDDLKRRNSELEIIAVDVKKLDTYTHELLHQIEMQNQEIFILTQQNNDLSEERDNMNVQIRRLNDKINNNDNNNKMHKSIMESDLVNQIHILNSQVLDRDNQIKIYNQQITSLQQQIKHLQSTVNQLKESTQQEKEDISQQQQRQFAEYQESIDKKCQLLIKEIEQRDKERSELLRDLQNVQQAKLICDGNNNQLQRDMDRTKHMLKQKAEELGINQQNINILNEKLTQQIKENASIQEQLSKLLYSKSEYDKEQQQLQMVLCYIEMDAMRNKLNATLQELENIRSNSVSMYKY